jgi:hypothetical protein
MVPPLAGLQAYRNAHMDRLKAGSWKLKAVRVMSFPLSLELLASSFELMLPGPQA